MIRMTAPISSLTLAVFIACGALLLWAGLVQIVTHVVALVVGSPAELVFRGVGMDENGDPTVTVRDIKPGVPQQYRYTDLNGNHRDKPVDQFEFRMTIESLPMYANGTQLADSQLKRVSSVAQSSNPLECWFLVHDGRSSGGCWLECYTPPIPGKVMCIGASGASLKIPEQSAKFSIRLADIVMTHVVSDYKGSSTMNYDSPRSFNLRFLATSAGIYVIDFKDRTALKFSERPAGFIRMDVGLRYDAEPKKNQGNTYDPANWCLLIRTRNSLIRMDAAGGDVMQISLPEDVRDSRIFYSESFANRRFLHTSSIVSHYEKSFVKGAIFEVSENGELLNRRDYAWENSTGNPTEFADSLRLGMSAPSPLIAASAAGISAAAGTPWSRLQSWLRFMPAVLSGLIGAWLCRRHQASLGHQAGPGHSHRILWLAFVVLFGVFGYIGYRYHRRWPVRNSEFESVNGSAPPPMTGIEVFG